MMNKEFEITEPVFLCNQYGNLNENSIGWARRPIITSNLSGNFLRKKKWNYWCVFGREALFSATISHLDYASVCFVYYLHYETKRYVEKTIISLFGQHCHMPEEVQKNVEVVHKNLSLFFISTEEETLLKVSCPNFDGQVLEADIKLTYPSNLNTLNVVVPWTNGKFQFTAKHHCLPAEGFFKIGKEKFTFNPDTDFGVLDYGRGVWPRKSTWNWGMASGKQNDDIIGLNFGGKWTDHTGSTENAVIINGKITKISEDVQFSFDPSDYMKEWKITSHSNRINLTFKPLFERIAKTNVLIISSEVHQMVGHYFGEIKLSETKTLMLDGLLGCIEDHKAKW